MKYRRLSITFPAPPTEEAMKFLELYVREIKEEQIKFLQSKKQRFNGWRAKPLELMGNMGKAGLDGLRNQMDFMSNRMDLYFKLNKVTDTNYTITYPEDMSGLEKMAGIGKVAGTIRKAVEIFANSTNAIEKDLRELVVPDMGFKKEEVKIEKDTFEVI